MIKAGKLEKIVGVGNVCSDQATLEAYAKDMSFVERGQTGLHR